MEALSREESLSRLVSLALAEDLGSGDVTSEATVPEAETARATIIRKAAGVVSGLDALDEVYHQLGGVEVRRWPAPDIVAELSGDARRLLAGERVALNFLGHLSGVATLTARFAEVVAGTGAQILDTRKTTPGMRLLEKEAVADGGGVNHRVGLFDAVLIKENHIAIAGGVAPAVESARVLAAAHQADPAAPVGGDSGRMLVQVECESIKQLREALDAGADRILLDNMAVQQLHEAVAVRDGAAAGAARVVLLEASGGITLANAREIAEAGVDLISVGALTHSAPALDLSMRIEIG